MARRNKTKSKEHRDRAIMGQTGSKSRDEDGNLLYQSKSRPSSSKKAQRINGCYCKRLRFNEDGKLIKPGKPIRLKGRRIRKNKSMALPS